MQYTLITSTRPAFGRFGRRLTQGISVLLCVALMATSAPAAPLVLKDLASRARLGAALWYDSSGWATALREGITGQRRPAPAGEQKQEERDARVARVAVSPGGEITVRVGERVRFAAVAFDQAGAAVGGVKFKWEARDEGRGQKTRISRSGEFIARARGTFTVTAQGAGHRAQATVKVLEGERTRRPNEKPDRVKEVSTRDLPPDAAAKKRQARPKRVEQARRSGAAIFMKASFAPAAAAEPVEPEPAPAPAAAMIAPDGWNQDNYYYADDPGNETGNPPGGPLDGGAGNGNYQISAPVIALPGRGIDLALALTYNSRVWGKTGTYEMTFDPDRTWPAPGWSLGFGKMVGMGMGGTMLVEADGTRRGFTGTATNYGSSIYFNGQTSDGSFIDYYSSTYNGSMYYGYAQLSNGTYIEYGAFGEGALYPTLIRDVNGNYIAVTYRNNRGPQIETVTDTLGRVVTFNYDGSELLTSVTAPNLGGGTRTLVELQYTWRSVAYNFPGMTVRVRAGVFPFLEAIRYPSTGTGYWFGDSDSYSPYGMIAKVSERRGMGTGGPISPGVQTSGDVYNYPMDTSAGYSDAPGYTTKTETWEGIDTAAPVTRYAVFQNSSPRRVEITYPNDTKNIQYSFNSPGTYLDGLVYNDVTLDAAGNTLHSSTVSWEQGAYSSPRPWRMEVTDERQQTKKTEYTYGSLYNQVIEARDYDYGGSLLKKTVTQYENGQNYINNHVFSLPKVVEVYAADGYTRVSRSEYTYDGQPLADTPGVIMHMESHNPYSPQYWVEGYCREECYDYPYDCQWRCEPGYWTSDYNPSTDYRGNVTQVTTYADAANLTGAATEARAYDINGNQVTASTACCDQTLVTFSPGTYYAYPVSQSRGSASDPAQRVTVSAVYDFYTGLILNGTDENGRTSQNVFEPATLRLQQNIAPTGARTTYEYDDNQLKVTETTTAAPAEGGAVASQTVKYLNGTGQVRLQHALGAGGAWDAVETKYDQLGRVWKQSRPYRVGQESPQMTEHVYDALGRVTETLMPGGSQTRVFYNEATRPSAASGAPGETTRTIDPWGRERWGRSDVQGRLVEVVEPDPNGGGSVLNHGMATTYAYDTLGNLTLVTQGAQERRFRFDSLGRKTHQKLAETAATLNDAGQYVGPGGPGAQWSDVFAYDSRSNLVSRVDARGVVATFSYENDPLNRVHSVSYTVGVAHDTSSPILPAASSNYEYATTGDLMRVKKVMTVGVSTLEYDFDSEGRTGEQKLTLDSRPYHPLVTNYGYDSLDRVVSVTYPQQYPSGTRKTVTQSYDAASRLSGLQVGGVVYASDISYNASSQVTSLNVGVGVGNWKQEKYGYDPVTGLLTNQKVLRAGNEGEKLIDLSYDYLRPGTASGITGEVTRITDNINGTKSRGFEYDAVGRLRRATGGSDGRWTQRYHYDRYGNRWNTFSQTAEQMVRNFHQVAFNRQPNSAELQQWTDALRAGYWQGQSQLWAQAKAMGDQLFSSAEYAARNRTDHEYVYDLYKAYLNREPDQGGWDWWTGEVGRNGRAAVRDGFAYSEEFSLNLQGLSPNSPANGIVVPRDGLGAMSYDQATNRINSPGWQYDAAGNQTRAVSPVNGAWQRMEYDAAGRLVNVKDDWGNLLASYTYGETNARLVAHEGGMRTYYAWSAAGVIAEYAEQAGYSSPQWSKNYVYLGGRLLATQQPGGSGELVQYHHPDGLGTRLVTNAYDTGYFEQATLPYGAGLAAESLQATNRLFTSYDRSGVTGIDYAVNRHYDPMQGRFTQVDPLEMGAVDLSDPQTLNLYAYCANDPVNRTDELGLSFLGKLFGWIGKIFKWAATAVAVALIVIAVIVFPQGTIPLLVMSGLLLGVAHGPPWLQRAISAAGRFGSLYKGFGPGGTPVFNPNAGTGLTGGVGPVRNFIFRFQEGEEILDFGDVITINTNICANGNKYPHCGAGWWGIAPVVGDAWEAHDAFRSGRWGWGILYTASAVSDVLVVGVLVKGGGKVIIKGGAKLLARRRNQAVQVSRWGRPGLQSGDWVTKGGPTRWNYFKTGKWERTPWNEYAPFKSGETFLVPRSTLKLPEGASKWKGLFGHRKYHGPSLPPNRP